MGEGEWREEGLTGRVNYMILGFFCGKLKQSCFISSSIKEGSLDRDGLVWKLLPWGNSVMLNSECAYLGASPLVGEQTKQESISSQPGCLFSQNCRNFIPLETSVPLSDLPKIDQQIQRSPGSIKHEHINLISFGNWKIKQQSIFCTIPNKNLLMLFS